MAGRLLIPRRPALVAGVLGAAACVGLCLALCLTACPSSGPRESASRPPARRSKPSSVLRGKAAWYGGKFHGRKTASGEIFDKNAMTAAHRTLPFGTVVRVTNIRNGRAVTVRINDRGPYSKKRIIDMSEGAARKLGMIDSGVVPVKVVVVKRPGRGGKGKRR